MPEDRVIGVAVQEAHTHRGARNKWVSNIPFSIALLFLLLIIGFASGAIPNIFGHTGEEVALLTTTVTNNCPTREMCSAICPSGYYASAGSCAANHSANVRWNVSGVSADHQSWDCFDGSAASMTADAVTATVQCVKVGSWIALNPLPTCGNYKVEPGEACDRLNADACPGLCASDCTCSTPTGFCGDGTANLPNSDGLFEVVDEDGDGTWEGSEVSGSFGSYWDDNPLNAFPFWPDCTDFLDPYASAYNDAPTYFPNCAGSILKGSASCAGFDLSQCKPSCFGDPPWGNEGYPLNGAAYPPGNYTDPNHLSNQLPGGDGGAGGLTCGMSDPNNLDVYGYPKGKNGVPDEQDSDFLEDQGQTDPTYGENGATDASAGEQCDGGSPTSQMNACSGQITCGSGEVAQCGTNCKCECVSCELIDWNGKPDTDGDGEPDNDNGMGDPPAECFE